MGFNALLELKTKIFADFAIKIYDEVGSPIVFTLMGLCKGSTGEESFSSLNTKSNVEGTCQPF